MSEPTFTLRLAKRDFKFSIAHFTLFGPMEAEPLHGHNYRVTVEVEGRELDEAGLLADCGDLKRRIRALCAELDDRVVVPKESEWLQVIDGDEAVEVRFAERVYRLPAAEVVRLPIANTSMELLARFFWEALAASLPTDRIRELSVEIAETEGQSCAYRAPLPG
ncbi:MAG: 6-carboxytetrahydropterin synthase [Acidobacteria bacterium]|nr:6-carboxytetrahydropterin synthase [Acidobacteriota bacterium]MCB9377288.1 6-carboxytetrahydropterin synthase [Holophagales bacterium]